MARNELRSLIFAALLLALIPVAHAQEQTAPPANAPAAQSASDAASTTTTAPAPVPGKRVWTNDDMGDIHKNSTISTFSAPNAKSAGANAKPASAAKSKDAKRYQDQINALRAKEPPIDEKIAQLNAVLSGKTVQETRTYGGNHIDDWHEELLKLQKQREDLETRISAIQDQARHSGIPDNEIPQ
ncbi:MAG TPA: hypothetical protein VGD60_12625 [Candidatus Acidoferrales bacterium]